MRQPVTVTLAQYEPTPAEAEDLRAVAAKLAEPDAGPLAIAAKAPRMQDMLPDALREVLLRLRSGDDVHAVRIANLPLAVRELPPTPTDSHAEVRDATAFMCLIGSVLGDVYGFAAQQGGTLINDVCPSLSAVEIGNLSSGSRKPFPFHTEDTFHPCFPDYVLFLCLRNPDDVPVYVSGLDTPVRSEMWSVLSQPQFVHRPSPSHTGDTTLGLPLPILFGQPDLPHIRVNLANLDDSRLDTRARAGIADLTAMLRRNAAEIPCRVGDCVILDNLRTVHGRKPFNARFDGFDRWLKRATVIRDIRRCGAWCATASERMLGTGYA
jgi:Taurine catabolism dioxygenase TauD, TfdA family